MVGICALGLRDAVDKRAVMALTLGNVKARGPLATVQLIPQTCFGLSELGTILYWVYKTIEAYLYF